MLVDASWDYERHASERRDLGNLLRRNVDLIGPATAWKQKIFMRVGSRPGVIWGDQDKELFI